MRNLLDEVEKIVGKFSTYETTTGKAENIQFQDKPAQQLCASLGCSANAASALTSPPATGLYFNSDVTLPSGFSPGLSISKERLKRLHASAKVFLSEDLGWTPEKYKKYVESNPKAQDNSVDSENYWQNMAVGVCHTQEIDLLVSHQKYEDGKAYTAPREGAVDDSKPPILLLSSPALNITYGTAGNLTDLQRKAHIQAMYRNIFNAAVQSKLAYIAMPAAGLGVFGGNAAEYFSALMAVAKEFPKLNIIYHPGHPNNNTPFQSAMEAASNPLNVAQATKDVLYIADELCKRGIQCALHNPSDADVVYGVYDVGEYWKNGKGNGFVGEEDIGAKTTAVLGSKGLNPNAYANPVLVPKKIMQSSMAQEQQPPPTASPLTAANEEVAKHASEAPTANIGHNNSPSLSVQANQQSEQYVQAKTVEQASQVDDQHPAHSLAQPAASNVSPPPQASSTRLPPPLPQDNTPSVASNSNEQQPVAPKPPQQLSWQKGPWTSVIIDQVYEVNDWKAVAEKTKTALEGTGNFKDVKIELDSTTNQPKKYEGQYKDKTGNFENFSATLEIKTNPEKNATQITCQSRQLSYEQQFLLIAAQAFAAQQKASNISDKTSVSLLEISQRKGKDSAATEFQLKEGTQDIPLSHDENAAIAAYFKAGFEKVEYKGHTYSKANNLAALEEPKQAAVVVHQKNTPPPSSSGGPTL